MAVFPSSLPCVTEFRLTPAGQRADADPPGYSQRRNRTRSGWALADVEWFFLQSQLDTFEAFFKDDIYRGAAWFLMVLPITPEATGSPTQTCYSVVRFPEGYSMPVLHRQGYWRVRARIEIRDRFECALPPPPVFMLIFGVPRIADGMDDPGLQPVPAAYTGECFPPSDENSYVWDTRVLSVDADQSAIDAVIYELGRLSLADYNSQPAAAFDDCSWNSTPTEPCETSSNFTCRYIPNGNYLSNGNDPTFGGVFEVT
jgi:hypothetical protein